MIELALLGFAFLMGGVAGYYFARLERREVDGLRVELDEKRAGLEEKIREEGYQRGRRDALRGEIVHLQKLGAGGGGAESEPDPAVRLN